MKILLRSIVVIGIAIERRLSDASSVMKSRSGIYLESFCAMLKRGHQGIYHKFSPRHLDRYISEFPGRHNAREADTIDQMSGIVSGIAAKRLTYVALFADNGLAPGARV